MGIKLSDYINEDNIKIKTKTIEELIDEKINDWDDCLNRHYAGEAQNSDVLIRAALSDMEQLKSSLPTQQDKVVVPPCVDKFLSVGNKSQKLAYLVSCKYSILTCDMAEGELKQWLREISMDDLLSLANGYTVEKEQLYWIYDSIADQYLGYDRAEEKVWWLLKQNDGARAELTDAEITKVGEQYRAFAVPVEEDE